MTKIFERYIARAILTATGLITFIFVGVLSLMIMLGEMKQIGKGDYGLFEAIIYLLLRLPNELYQFSPLFVLLGSILGLSSLSTHRELVVMRASGFSMRRIMFSVLMSALFMVFTISLVGEWAGPSLSYKAELRKENAQHAGQAIFTPGGIWLHLDNNFIHVQRIMGKHLMKGVTYYQFDVNHRLQSTYFAKSLILKKNVWQLQDVVQTSFYDDHTASAAFAELPWDVKLNPSMLNLSLINPDKMSLPKLAKFARYLKRNGLQASEYQFDFWQRVFQPIASLVMIFLAISFVLGTLRTATLGRRMLLGILTGFVFFILNALLGELCVVYQLPTIFAAAFPPLIFTIVGFLLANKLVKN